MWSGAIIFTLFAIFSLIAYPGMRRRIPLSKQLLLYVLRVAKHNKSVYVIALAGTIVQTIYSVYWSISASPLLQSFGSWTSLLTRRRLRSSLPFTRNGRRTRVEPARAVATRAREH